MKLKTALIPGKCQLPLLAEYILSHATAFEMHRMVTQPNLTIFVSTTRPVLPQTVSGYDFRFIRLTPERLFGIARHWVDKERFVMVSDIERTILDGLLHPAHVGGITEVAKGMWMQRANIDMERILEYVRLLNVGVVVRRLGYLLEHYCLADAETLDSLRSMLTATYQRLDPLLPAEGPFLARWRVQLNVSAEELDAVRVG